MATALETSSAITAELEQFYADAEATQDFADDALLDWLDGSLTGFETNQPREPHHEVREPKPRLPHKNPVERLRTAKLHPVAGVVAFDADPWPQSHPLTVAPGSPARYLIAAPQTPTPSGLDARPDPTTR